MRIRNSIQSRRAIGLAPVALVMTLGALPALAESVTISTYSMSFTTANGTLAAPSWGTYQTNVLSPGTLSPSTFLSFSNFQVGYSAPVPFDFTSSADSTAAEWPIMAMEPTIQDCLGDAGLMDYLAGSNICSAYDPFRVSDSGSLWLIRTNFWTWDQTLSNGQVTLSFGGGNLEAQLPLVSLPGNLQSYPDGNGYFTVSYVGSTTATWPDGATHAPDDRHGDGSGDGGGTVPEPNCCALTLVGLGLVLRKRIAAGLRQAACNRHVQ